MLTRCLSWLLNMSSLLVLIKLKINKLLIKIIK